MHDASTSQLISLCCIPFIYLSFWETLKLDCNICVAKVSRHASEVGLDCIAGHVGCMYYAVNLHDNKLSNIRHGASIIEYQSGSQTANLLVSTDKKKGSSSWCAVHPHTYAQTHRSYSIYNLTVLVSFTFQLQEETKGSQSHELSSHCGHTESEDWACCSWNQQIHQRRVRHNKLPKMLA